MNNTSPILYKNIKIEEEAIKASSSIYNKLFS